MKIVRLEIESFRGAPDGAYDFAREGEVASLRTFTGRSGSGKSSLLAAIATAKEAAAPSAAPPRPAHCLARGRSEGRIDATWLLEAAEAEEAKAADLVVNTTWRFTATSAYLDAPAGLRKLFGRFDLSDAVPKVELVPDEVSTDTTRPLPDLPALRAHRSIERADKYAWAPSALTKSMLAEAVATGAALREKGILVAAEEEPGPTERYRRALSALAPRVLLGPLADFGDGPETTFAITGGADALRWRSLSASQRRAVTIAVAFSHLGLARSLVLWDAPDRYFGPDYAQAVAAIRAIVPEGQVVLATSPEAPELSGAFASSIG
jgi:hypothetical protein